MVIFNAIIFRENPGKLISRKVFWRNEPAMQHVYVRTIDTRLSREQRKHIRCCNHSENDPNPQNSQNIKELKKTTYTLVEYN